MSEKKQLLVNTIILGIGRLSAQAISLLLLPVYTAFLTTEEYGLVDLVLTYIALLAPLIIVQLDRSAFRFLIESRGRTEDIKRVVSSTLSIVLPALLLATLIFEIAGYSMNIPHQHLIAGVLIGSTLTLVPMQLARGLGNNRTYAIANILAAIMILIGIGWFVVYHKLGISGVFLANILSSTVVLIYLTFTLQLPKYISIDAINKDMQRRLLKFAWPLVPSAISWWVIKAFDRTIIVLVLGAAANGLYAAANKYALIFFTIYSIFDLSWTEAASKHIDSKNRDEFFSDVFNVSFRAFGAFGLLLIALTPYVFTILVGQDFQAAYNLIPILIIGGLVQAIVGQYSAIYIAKKATREVLLTSFVAAATSLTLNILLIKPLGLFGPALALVLAFLAMTIWRHFDIKRFVSITYRGLVFVQLATLYITILVLFYINTPLSNMLNLAIAILATILMTRSVSNLALKKIKTIYSLGILR